MLLALLTDLARLPDVTVCTTWDARLGPFPLGESDFHGSPLKIDCRTVLGIGDESEHFRQFAAECDATYVIAPELDDLLTQRCRAAVEAGGRNLNAAADAIKACSDKWATFGRLLSGDVPTVATARFDPTSSTIPFPYPVVVKPRFGAGAQNTFVVRNDDERRAAAVHFPSSSPTSEAIVQPFVAGRSLSVAAIFRSDGTPREIWPVGEQRLQMGSRFTYHGGRIPNDPQGLSLWPAVRLRAAVSDLIHRIRKLIPGLAGYVGIDFLLPEGHDSGPQIVDINARLTTGYLGYRRLTDDNLAARILWPDSDGVSVNWSTVPVEFLPDGTISAFG